MESLYTTLFQVPTSVTNTGNKLYAIHIELFTYLPAVFSFDVSVSLRLHHDFTVALKSAECFFTESGLGEIHVNSSHLMKYKA